MAIHSPPHLGTFIREIYMPLFGISDRTLANKLGVSPATLKNVLKGTSGINSEMSLRLAKTLGRSPESWLVMQNHYELWQARRTVNLDAVEKIEFYAV